MLMMFNDVDDVNDVNDVDDVDERIVGRVLSFDFVWMQYGHGNIRRKAIRYDTDTYTNRREDLKNLTIIIGMIVLHHLGVQNRIPEKSKSVCAAFIMRRLQTVNFGE